MKTAYKTKDGCVIRELKLRALKPDEVRLRVRACGICGTDLNEPEGKEKAEESFGHEMAGDILEVGSAVQGFRVGQKVVVESATPCGRCSNCRNVRQELCTDIQSFFFLEFFGFAEETIVPAICLISCEDMDAGVATLSEPLGVAIDMVRVADIKPTSRVVIMGQGPIGLMALALVKRSGVKKIFTSEFHSRTARCELSKRFGADCVIDPRETSLKDFDFGCEIDRVLVTSPPKTLADAFDIAVKGGIVSFIGIDYDQKRFCTFDVNEFHFKKLQLRASFASPALYTPLALDYLRDGTVDGNSLISHRIALSDINKAMDVARNDSSAVKVIVEP